MFFWFLAKVRRHSKLLRSFLFHHTSSQSATKVMLHQVIFHFQTLYFAISFFGLLYLFQRHEFSVGVLGVLSCLSNHIRSRGSSMAEGGEGLPGHNSTKCLRNLIQLRFCQNEIIISKRDRQSQTRSSLAAEAESEAEAKILFNSFHWL